jgi:hypothetical protein
VPTDRMSRPNRESENLPLNYNAMTITNEIIDFEAERLKIERQSEETIKVLTARGHVLDTSEWLTIARYADKYGLATNVVSNWIARGIVPPDCVEQLPVLNNIKLIKDQPYR